jgi:ribosomal protein S18 acetylase RimI-like enzyme
MLEIKQENKHFTDILFYFNHNREIFKSSLEVRVDLESYSKKLFEKAHQFWVYFKGEIVGFSACYFNRPEQDFGFISTISIIDRAQGGGFGKKLLEEIIAFGQRNGFKKIRLEVDKNNYKAKELYIKVGFHSIEEADSTLILERDLNY